jgi:hypothetical protein
MNIHSYIQGGVRQGPHAAYSAQLGRLRGSDDERQEGFSLGFSLGFRLVFGV